MSLSDTQCKNAHKHAKTINGKAFKLSDEKGLYLLLEPRVTGEWSKGWRVKYRLSGKEKLLSVGTYPDVSLSDARVQRDIIRKQVTEGINPSENRIAVKSSKAANVSNSFEIIAREWGQKKIDDWQEKNNRSKRMLGAVAISHGQP